MFHPLLRVIATRPELLAEHAQGYAELLSDGLARSFGEWRRRALFAATGLGLVSVAVTLGGVALMLWAVTPAADVQMPWALIAAPLGPLIVGGWCLLQARERSGSAGVDALRDQLAADLSMLAAAGRRAESAA